MGSISSFTAVGSVTHLSVLSRPDADSFVLGEVLTYTDGGSYSGRSVIYTCEVTIPPHGVGINVLLGRQATTGEYLSFDRPENTSSPTGDQDNDEWISKFEKELGGAHNVVAAQGMWLTWLSSNESTIRNGGQNVRDFLSEHFVRRLLGVVFRYALTPDKCEQEEMETAKRLKKTELYTEKVVQHLLQRDVVRDDMWPGGIVAGALLPLGDWVNLPAYKQTDSDNRHSSAISFSLCDMSKRFPHRPSSSF